MVCFSFGGITGLILASCVMDTFLHDSYFVIGHFHYVLSLGVINILFGVFFEYVLVFIDVNDINYWVIGLSSILLLLYSSLLFLPLHFLGLLGVNRRVIDYDLIYFDG